jgi:RyR domain
VGGIGIAAATAPRRAELSRDERETIARTIHEAHREEAAVRDLPPWDKLEASLQDSNRLQADHIFEKLREIGCAVHPVAGRKIALMEFSDEEVETMAEMEHGRWNAERLSRGWRWGQRRDVERKTSPHLVSWSELPEDVRQWDRDTVRRIPGYLAEVGLEIRREPAPG